MILLKFQIPCYDTLIPANHPDNVSYGGVGILNRNSLPLNFRSDLYFSEYLVVELKFGRKKIFCCHT